MLQLIMNRYFFTIFLSFFSLSLLGQPVLIDLQDNTTLLHHHHISTKNTKNIDTLSLPFFDDFSQKSIFPDSSRWLDNETFINCDFPDNPPSIGVATFDMLNAEGKVYSNANSSQFIADHLTSMPIDLSPPHDTNIALSFFYQPQGLGANAPEESDSLVLQFFSPVTKTWYSVWHTAGDTNRPFQQVIISIQDSIFLQKGFQFRFFNYGSIADNSYASWAGSGDFWHLDWVYLAQNTNHTILPDVAMTKNMVSFLTDFEAVPWSHFSSSLVKKQILFSYTNHDTATWNVGRHLLISEQKTDTYINNLNLGNENISSGQTINYNGIFNGNPFPNNGEDSADFLMEAYLQTDTTANRQRYRHNDTLYYHQKFEDYYAYDDGTAEAGIGLYGNGTEHAYMAYQFTPVKNDTLWGVRIYFNRTYNDASRRYFLLTIWDDNNGKPGDTLFSRIGYRPNYADSLNGFTTYLTDTPIYIEHTFYVGWQKTTEDMLNVGFDRNRDASDKTFYNIYGTWEQIPFTGALMVRPILSDKKPLGISFAKRQKDAITIYPNPASEKLFINGTLKQDYTAVIYNLYGQILKSFSPTQQQSVNISNLPTGIYFLCVYNRQHVLTAKKKFIIAR